MNRTIGGNETCHQGADTEHPEHLGMLHHFHLLLTEILADDGLGNDIQPYQHEEYGHTGHRTDDNQYQLEHGHQDAEESRHTALGIHVIPMIISIHGSIHLLLGLIGNLIGQRLRIDGLTLHLQPVLGCGSRRQQNGQYHIGDDGSQVHEPDMH